MTVFSETLWTCSGDSHFIEPPDLFRERLPKDLADRLPRSERISDDEEIVHIDGRTIRRRLPKASSPEMTEAWRKFREGMAQGGRGASSSEARLEALDDQGVWGEVVFPSLGLWYGEIEDAHLVSEAARVMNDFVKEELIDRSPRFVPTATLPLQSKELSIAEARRVADLGFKAVFLPTTLDESCPRWNEDHWNDLWSTLEATAFSMLTA